MALENDDLIVVQKSGGGELRKAKVGDIKPDIVIPEVYWTEDSGNLYPTDLANNVGIGTDEPVAKVNIASDSSTVVVLQRGLDEDSTAKQRLEVGCHKLTNCFPDDNQKKFVIQSKNVDLDETKTNIVFGVDGRVAIGNVSKPEHKLDILGNGGTELADNEIRLTNPDGEARQISFHGTGSTTWAFKCNGLTGDNTFELNKGLSAITTWNTNGDVFIGGSHVRSTFELWRSTLTAEQQEQYQAGTLPVPANVSTPGNGEYARQWYYNQQSIEDQSLIDAGVHNYPLSFQPGSFTDTFDLGDTTNIDLYANGKAYFKGNVGISVKPAETLSNFHIRKNGGIGLTTTAASTVALVESNANCGLQLSSASDKSGQILFGDVESNSVGRVSYSHDRDRMSFMTDGSDRLYLTKDGRLGLTASDPNANLEVGMDAPDVPAIYVSKYRESSTTSAIALTGTAAIRSASLDYVVNKNGSHSWFTGVSDIDGNNTTSLQGIAGTEPIMKLTSDGDLGIGVETPEEKLHVDGGIRFISLDLEDLPELP